MTRRERDAKRRQRLDIVRSELGGTLSTCIVIRCENMGRILGMAMQGDKVRARAVLAVADWLKAKKPERPMCGCCEHLFRNAPLAFFIVFRTHDPSAIIISGICIKCYALPDDEIERRCFANLEPIVGVARPVDGNTFTEGGSA